MYVRKALSTDAIPSIDEPAFDDGYFGDSDDDVIVVDDTVSKAYPVCILHRHEIVNDRLNDGTPIAVTWCPLCGSAIVYDCVVDGSTLTFGVSGKLADDDLVMYDRETDSEWKQSLGQCITGEHEGKELAVRPAAITTWEVFCREHPEGVILQPPVEEHGLDETDSESNPYESSVRSEGVGLAARRNDENGREWDRTDLDPKNVVLGIKADDDALSFPRPTVEAAGGFIRAEVGDTGVVVFASNDGMHAYQDPGFEFQPEASDVFSGDGTNWDSATGRVAYGRHLTRLPVKRLYAFAWQDDHGPDAFYGI